MILDAGDKFITQREGPRLATIKAGPSEGGFVLALPGEAPVQVARPDGSRRLSVQVWQSIVDVVLADDGVNDLLSAFLGRAVKLVCMDDKASRVGDEVKVLERRGLCPIWPGS